MENTKFSFDSFLTGLLSVFYSKEKKHERILLLLVLVAFIFRLVAAINLDFNADDAIYASQSANIIKTGLLSTHSHPPLFFYLTDLSYTLFGYTTLAARLIPLIAGTLLIIVVYFLGTKLFNKNVGLAAAFFAVLCNFMIKMTFTEHSSLIFFLSFLGIYVGLLFLDTNKMYYLIISSILFGLSILTKYNGAFFLISFAIFALYYYKSKKTAVFSKEKIKSFIILSAVVLILALPFLFFNYIVYHEKGLLDWQFAITLKKPSALALFSGLAGGDKQFSELALDPSIYNNISLTFKTDLILSIFAVFGLGLLIYRRQKDNLCLLILLFIIPFFLQSLGSNLSKHFEFMHILATILAGYSLVFLKEKVNKNIFKVIVAALLVLLLINIYSNNVGVPSGITVKSPSSQLKSYISNNVYQNDLIVFDDRIYTARTFWLATDSNFLTMQQFGQFYNYNMNLSKSQLTNVDVYFVECAIDDCGWGIDKVKGSLNDSSELIFSQIKNISTEVHETKGLNDVTYRVYKARMGLNQQLVSSVKYGQSFYFAPYLYLNMDNYVFNYDKSKYPLMSSLGVLIIKIAMLLTFLSFLYVLYLIFADSK